MAERLFPGLTGQGVRIAVIDSGVHRDHPHINVARIGMGVAIAPDGSLSNDPAATVDRLGHGTAVTAAVQEKAGEGICLPVRVFNDALKTSARVLIAAIRWAIEADADIVNLSLGSPNAAHVEVFTAAAEAAREAGVLLVAAHEANGVPCYPGALPQVLGVGLDWDCPRERYRADPAHPGVLVASGYPRPIPGVPLQRNLYGISFAVAQISGFAALACERLGRDLDGPDRVDALRQMLADELSSANTSIRS